MPHPLYCPGLGLATQCQEEEQGQLTLTVAQVWQSSQFRILVIGVNLAMNMCYCLPSLLPRSHWQPGGRKNLQRLGPTVAQVRQLTEFVQEILVYFEATMCLSQHCLTSTCCPGQAGNRVWKEEPSEAWPYCCPVAAIDRICTGYSSIF